jgi:hypothetical protein
MQRLGNRALRKDLKAACFWVLGSYQAITANTARLPSNKNGGAKFGFVVSVAIRVT